MTIRNDRIPFGSLLQPNLKISPTSHARTRRTQSFSAPGRWSDAHMAPDVMTISIQQAALESKMMCSLRASYTVCLVNSALGVPGSPACLHYCSYPTRVGTQAVRTTPEYSPAQPWKTILVDTNEPRQDSRGGPKDDIAGHLINFAADRVVSTNEPHQPI